MKLNISDRNKVKNILVISLSNIGDIILTFPVLEILKRDFPSAKLSIVVGPKGESLFQKNPFLDQVYIFDKHQSPLKMIQWIFKLRKKAFDCVIDLRHTAIPFFLAPKYRAPLLARPKNHLHRLEKHLNRLKTIYPFDPFRVNPEQSRRVENHVIREKILCVPEEDKDYVRQLQREQSFEGQKYVVFAPGAANHEKRWTPEGFAQVGDQLIEKFQWQVILVGDDKDQDCAQKVLSLMKQRGVNLCGTLTLLQLAELLSRCQLALVNDSAVMHLASYLDVPVVALFGPTDPEYYGPWSERSSFIRRSLYCPACLSQDKRGQGLKHQCLQAILPEDVLEAVRKLVEI